MRVFAYLRVSGKGQLDGDGFPRQQEEIEKYCARKGWVVSRTFAEKGVTGTSVDRPAFAEMLGLTGPGTSNIIVVERADRLARDLIVNELLVKEAIDRGVKIFEAASDTDLTNSDDPTRVMIRQILAVLAEWNKSVTVKRLRAARDRIRSQTGRCEGPKPFELATQRGTELVRSIYEMHERGMSFAEIAQYFNKNHILTPKGKTYWHKSTVQKFYERYSNSLHCPARVIKPICDVFGDPLPEPQV